MPIDGIFDYTPRQQMSAKDRKAWNDWWSRLRNPNDPTSPYHKPTEDPNG